MNLKQKQMQQEELTRERMAYLTNQANQQFAVEQSRQRLGLLHETVDLLKASGDDIDLNKIREWYKEISTMILNPPQEGK